MVTQPAALYAHGTKEMRSTDTTEANGQLKEPRKRRLSLEEQPLEPVLQEFKDFIDHNPLIRNLTIKMFEELPKTPPYGKDVTLKPQIRSYIEMFQRLNIILREGPQWYISDDPIAMDFIGFPINAMLNWLMGTRSGYEFFRNPSVNAHWKAVLNKWKDLLSSSESLRILDPVTGWTSPDAIRILTDNGNNYEDSYTFPQLYQCDPSAPYYGFASWDDFFTRRFNHGVRPIANPDEDLPNASVSVNPTAVIVNACESKPYCRKENVKLHDTFWLKGQPYSLADMLNGEDIARPFIGGQVYQAYLSALSYHRWHAPVSGTVVSIENVAGTYYSENLYEGFANMVDDQPRPDPSASTNSQAYLAEVATRGIMIIQADNQKIGLMAAVFIGMAEVSSCEFFVKAGDRITKGQEIGSFHFGGSTSCLVFRPQTKLSFVSPEPCENGTRNKKVNSCLAVVV